MKRVLPTLVLALITVAALAFIYKDRIFKKTASEHAVSSSGGHPGMRRHRRHGGGHKAGSKRVVPILAEVAKAADVPVYLYGVGTVQAYNTATVRAQVSGRLIAVNYREGQQVNKGDVLARIDPTTYKAAYDQAVAKKAMNEAQLGNARLDLKRYKGLAKTNYGTKQQADTQASKVAQLEAQVRQDQAAVDSAKANLDYTTIEAPISGRTGIRAVDVGNLVSASDASGITTITQIKPVSVVFTLPETEVGELVAAKSRGTVALVASIGGKPVGGGQLEVIDNRIDQTTGTVKLKGVFPNAELKLWPGQFVNVRLLLKTLPKVTVVPASAVQQGAKGRYVYVVQPKNVVKLTTVTTGQEDENQVVITQGVKPGDKVATSGFSNLKDGAKISLGDGKKPGKAGKRPQNKKKRHNGKGSDKPSISGSAKAAPAKASASSSAVAASKVAPQRQATPQKHTD
ncbi:MAG: efflux RND transporter periplasmic adaptor subunit [Alphaproteobacteria bacterium]